MTTPVILVLNAGSSSLKWALYQGDGKTILQRGATDVDASGILAAIEQTLSALPTNPIAVVHRIVHGGADYAAPVLITPDIMRDLARLVDLAPLHQPAGLAGITAAKAIWPDLPMIAAFDTAFHRGHAAHIERFALPEACYTAGIRRYGFHGLSYQYITANLRLGDPDLLAGRLVVAHLGAGASLCAIQNGRSVDSTMGFTALDGLPMATRCGSIDPGVVLHLLRQGQSPADIETMLYKKSGLLGLSGLSSDMRVLLTAAANGHAGATLAIRHFTARIAREIAAMATTLCGIDGLVFTGGIGTHAPPVRDQVLTELSWLGFTIDHGANDQNHRIITRPGSIPSLVIATDEEAVMAEAAVKLIAVSS